MAIILQIRPRPAKGTNPAVVAPGTHLTGVANRPQMLIAKILAHALQKLRGGMVSQLRLGLRMARDISPEHRGTARAKLALESRRKSHRVYTRY